MLLDPRNVCIKIDDDQYAYFTSQHYGSLHSTVQKAGIYDEATALAYFNALV